MIQRTLRARISSLESPDNIARAFLQFLWILAFRHQLILFVSTSLSSWPRLLCERRPANPTATVSLPSTPVPSTRVRLPRAAHPQGGQPSIHCFPLQITSGKQT